MSETEYLKILREKLEERRGEGPISGWTDIHFVRLSEEISTTTRILISKNTLKRLFGKIKVADDYKPQKETKNALARYLGYRSWSDFCFQHQPPGSESQPEREEAESEPVRSSGRPSLPKRAVFLLLLLVGLAGLGYWWLSRHSALPPADAVQFEVKNPIDTVPFTLVLKYNAASLQKDCVNVNFDGPIYLSTDRNTFTSNITLPSYRWLTLREGSKPIKSAPIHCLSRGWEPWLFSLKPPVRLPAEEALRGGTGKLQPEAWQRYPDIDSLHANLEFRQVRNFEASGDDFSLQTRVRIPSGTNPCHGFTLKIFGEHGHNEVRLFPKGCRQHNFVFLSEKVFMGRYADLTEFPFEGNQWNDLQLAARGKTITLSVNGRVSFRESYQKSIGPIKAILVNLGNQGEIDYLYLRNQRGEWVEKAEFGP